jgi:hypothetical protein
LSVVAEAQLAAREEEVLDWEMDWNDVGSIQKEGGERGSAREVQR